MNTVRIVSFSYKTPVGIITIAEDGSGITNLFFNNEETYVKLFSPEQTETPLLQKTASQLYAYFEGKRKTFDIPLNPAGTDFQKKVWNALRCIPFGQTRSYGGIAKDIGNKNAFRAVGGANNKNPIAIIVPCHRVIGANGTLVGYAGGLSIKEFLLNLEKKYTTHI